jgi:histidine ammonia-lyase
VRTLIREHVEGPGTDRFLAPEIEAVNTLVAAGSLLDAASAAVGQPLR